MYDRMSATHSNSTVLASSRQSPRWNDYRAVMASGAMGTDSIAASA
jgi:hypothetical protein